MKGTVYLLGAGASHGEDLVSLQVAELAEGIGAKPPLANGFFSESVLNKIAPSARAFGSHLQDAIPYIRLHWGFQDDFGSGRWNSLSLEQVLSHVEREVEFLAGDTKNWMDRLKVRNQLVSHIYRVIGLCTEGKFGKKSRSLACGLERDDSVICFNWDLLLDFEFLSNKGLPQYSSFLESLETYPPGDPQVDYPWQRGLFLKPHGSLNWFRCSNPACPTSHSFVFKADVQDCLRLAVLPQWGFCPNCGEKTTPLIVPPVGPKRITEDPIIRHIWGLARRKLQFAKKLVVVGFSVAPFDFYAEWLLRSSAMHLRVDDIFLINPCSDPSSEGHAAFMSRMNEIFPRGFNSEFKNFSQIDAVVERVKRESSS